MSVAAQDLPCTEKCRSMRHGREICRIALKGTDEEIIALWMKTCLNYGHVRDEFGRTALHMTASMGKVGAVEWLIKRENSLVNLKDLESGYTPLHRSLFYGQISTARLLVKLGADMTVRDNEGFTPLDLIATPEELRSFNISSEPTELYVWGRNQNFNLGIENQQDRLHPEVLEKFGLDNDRIDDVVFQQFHSLFKTQLGGLYVCGHGEGGRLGTGNERAVLTPKRISNDSDRVVHLSASANHTIVVYESGNVSTCGSNEYAVLGHNPPLDKVLTLKLVRFGSNIKMSKCAACNFHSVFYNKENVYVCGTNEGQFGHQTDQGTKVFKPIKIPSLVLSNKGGKSPYIETVACNDSATAVVEKSGDATTVYLFNNHSHFVIKFGMMTLDKLSVLGGFQGKNVGCDKSSKFGKESDRSGEGPITLAFINGEDINVWRQDSMKTQRKTSGFPSITHGRGEGTMSKLLFNTSRQIGQSATTKSRYSVKDFCVNLNSFLFITVEGTGYTSPWTSRNPPLYLESKEYRPVTYTENKMQLTDHGFKVQNLSKKSGNLVFHDVTLELLKAKRIPNIYCGEKVISDSRGNNFAVILRNPRCHFTAFPWPSESSLTKDISLLYEELNEGDNLHDVIFQVEGRRFPAHRFIIASVCPALYKIIQQGPSSSKSEEPPLVKIDSVSAMIFEQTLKFIYTCDCDVTTSFNGQFQFHSSKNINLIKEMLQFAKRISLPTFWERVKNFEMRGDRVHLKHEIDPVKMTENRRLIFRCDTHMDICDIVLKCLDGELKAHRCILAPRVTYFAAMFSSSWCQDTSMKTMTVTHSQLAVKAMLQFVYEDDSKLLDVCEIDVLSEILVLADEFLLPRLLSQVESQLAARLNLRNVLEILQCADVYNADQLKESCMDFISPHLGQLLENRAIDQIAKELVNELTEYYKCNHYKNRGKHIEKCDGEEAPDRQEYEEAMDSIAPDIQLILSDLDNIVSVEHRKPTPKSSKVRMRARTISETEVENISVANIPLIFPEEPSVSEEIPNSGSPSPSDWMSTSEQKEKVKTSKIFIPLPTQKLQKEKRDFNLEEFPSLGSPPGKSISSPVSDEKPSCSKSSGGVKKRRKWKSLSEKEVEVAPVVPTSEIPSNPWIKTWEKKAEPGIENEKAFKMIVEEEQEKKSNLEKAISKPMQLLVIEEAAIAQLIKRYTTEDVVNSVETISVERMTPKNYAQPTWVSQAPRAGNS